MLNLFNATVDQRQWKIVDNLNRYNFVKKRSYNDPLGLIFQARGSHFNTSESVFLKDDFTSRREWKSEGIFLAKKKEKKKKESEKFKRARGRWKNLSRD